MTSKSFNAPIFTDGTLHSKAAKVMFLQASVILFTGANIQVWLSGVYLREGESASQERSASQGVCLPLLARCTTPLGHAKIRSIGGLYASYWNAFLLTLEDRRPPNSYQKGYISICAKCKKKVLNMHI